jgi:hypothetical protein
VPLSLLGFALLSVVFCRACPENREHYGVKIESQSPAGGTVLTGS